MGADERDAGLKEGYEVGMEEGYKEGYKEGLVEGANSMKAEAFSKICKYFENEGFVSSVEEAEAKANEILEMPLEEVRSRESLRKNR